ncbi:MAG TPA: outer membrane lipoprotein carrier protein LolA [Thermoanaerobaculia bacterium]|nr:outer membrane lipoprotein carrier protein LolA [Thermoanaerobaculia bacterium]
MRRSALIVALVLPSLISAAGIYSLQAMAAPRALRVQPTQQTPPTQPARATQNTALPDPLAPNLSGKQRLQALLERVKLQQRQAKTVEARFVQRRQSAMLVSPEESNGVFSYAAPDRVRWEYLSPTPITVVIRGNEMTTWYRDLKRAETLKIGRYSNQIFKFLGAGASVDTLLDYFTVSLGLARKPGDPYHLELKPRYERIKKRLKTMTIAIDAEGFYPVRVKYEEADGDTTEYEFKDFQWNAPMPADRFALQLPPGVENRVVDLGADPKSKSRP